MRLKWDLFHVLVKATYVLRAVKLQQISEGNKHQQSLDLCSRSHLNNQHAKVVQHPVKCLSEYNVWIQQLTRKQHLELATCRSTLALNFRLLVIMTIDITAPSKTGFSEPPVELLYRLRNISQQIWSIALILKFASRGKRLFIFHSIKLAMLYAFVIVNKSRKIPQPTMSQSASQYFLPSVALGREPIDFYWRRKEHRLIVSRYITIYWLVPPVSLYVLYLQICAKINYMSSTNSVWHSMFFKQQWSFMAQGNKLHQALAT